LTAATKRGSGSESKSPAAGSAPDPSPTGTLLRKLRQEPKTDSDTTRAFRQD